MIVSGLCAVNDVFAKGRVAMLGIFPWRFLSPKLRTLRTDYRLKRSSTLKRDILLPKLYLFACLAIFAV